MEALQGGAEYRVGDALVRVGVRAIPFGIAAVVMGFVLKSPGTQAGPADIGSRSGISVFGTIHPDIFRLRRRSGHSRPSRACGWRAWSPGSDFEAGGNDRDTAPDTPASACPNASFDERFAALDDRAASFGERFASVDERPAPFGERFALATQELTGSVRLPPDRDVRKAFRPMGRLTDTPPTASAANRHVRPGQARKDFDPLPDDGRTAIYDISARAVYLPNGRKLEAHSGLGAFMDNPRHVHLRMRGATPPNVYRLSMRESLFHGVRAIRLNPVDSGRMYGRAGILAHTYMLGPNGQSNGCVSFKNYPEFLNAYLKDEVTRLVVVERLDNPPGAKLASGWLPDVLRKLFAGSDNSDQYAAATSP